MLVSFYQPILTAVGNWQREIFGYFEHPITNAYTESLNNLIRVMNRLGRGYSFEALRAKILFAEGAYKHVNSRPKFERKTPAPALKNFEVGFYTPSPPPPAFSVMESQPEAEYMQKSIEREKSEKNYGVDISTLVRMIEAGEI